MLVGFTSRWTVFDANALRDNPKNHRELIEEQQIRRGLIRAGDDTVLARSLKQADKSYVRTYPQGRLFSHAVGYTSCARAAPAWSALRRRPERADQRAQLAHRPPVGVRAGGRRLVTTLNPAAQRVALQQLAGRKGAVVALDPRTGRSR